MEPDHFWGLLYSEVAGFIIALFSCALFSFLETTVTALRLFKLKELATTTPRYKRILETLENNPHQVLVTILIASSLSNVTAAALITTIMEQVFARLHLSSGLGFSVGVGFGTLAIMLFGEVIPKNVAKIHGEKLFKSALWITNMAFYILYPLVRLLINFSDFFIPLFGGKTESTELVTSEREIRFLIDYINKKGLIETEKTEMLQSIFNFGSKPVKEIMVPMIDIIMIGTTESLKDALTIFSTYQFSRLPVYENTPDNVIGLIYQKDIFALLSKGEDKPLIDLVRPIIFVPEGMKINQLLRQFKVERMHMAMVINEYGNVTGLVTLEDVLEEIVGEINDEYEEITERIVTLQKGGWLVDATVDLDTLSELLGITFDVEDVFTLGGFLMEHMQHLPKKDERTLYKNYCFQVHKASHKRVIQVLIYKEGDSEPIVSG